MTGRRIRPRNPGFRLCNCSCPDCRAACLSSPGWFLPGQIRTLARRLEVPATEVFRRYLGVGATRLPNGRLRRGVMPHKLHDNKAPGGIWTLKEMAVPGRCIFYDRGECTIYPIRPLECALMIHGREADAMRLRRFIVRFWTDEQLAPYLDAARSRK